MNDIEIAVRNLRVPFPADPVLDVPFRAEATLFPRLATDRMKAANNSNRQSPVNRQQKKKKQTKHEQMNILMRLR